ncbi:MAG: DUF2461 domain-containing protein [Myxococcota bacterium]
MSAPTLPPELFDFFRELAVHNDREWFAENKERYEAQVKGPLLDFINGFAPKLNAISPQIVADSRPNGGSMFRIYRDTRFSKDKTPYKTHAALQFRHAAGKDVHAPGFYLHLEPDSVFMGAGLWRPETKYANAIREAILEAPERWKKATRKKSFADKFELRGESLKRRPKMVDTDDHPLIEDLKRKDFIAVHDFDAAEALQSNFLSTFAARCRVASDFMSFLCEAVELEY